MDGVFAFFSALRGCDRDVELMLSLINGDEASMPEFYDRWAVGVYSMVRLLLAEGATPGEAVDASAATKATFVELWRTAPTRPLDQNVPSWVWTTTQLMTRAQLLAQAPVITT